MPLSALDEHSAAHVAELFRAFSDTSRVRIGTKTPESLRFDKEQTMSRALKFFKEKDSYA